MSSSCPRLSPLPWTVLIACALLSACGTTAKPKSAPLFMEESFDSDSIYSRSYATASVSACEAARRALLGQGYVVTRATGEAVEATKNFQPGAEDHLQLDLRVSCVEHGAGQALVFVSAVQDRYALKKNPTSASVGVGVLGSVSLPIGSSDDSLVRVASKTVSDAEFYKRFFDRLNYYLPSPPDAAPAPAPSPVP